MASKQPGCLNLEGWQSDGIIMYIALQKSVHICIPEHEPLLDARTEAFNKQMLTSRRMFDRMLNRMTKRIPTVLVPRVVPGRIAATEVSKVP